MIINHMLQELKKEEENLQIYSKQKTEIATENIPLQDISSPQEVQDIISTAIDAETAVKTVETSLTTTDASVQTDMKKREMDGIMKAMTSVKEEIANELVKLNETNK